MKKNLGPQTLAYPTPAWLVATYDDQGKPNVMTAAWGGICCSQPPCLAVSLRKVTSSYGNLMKRRAFTINIPSQDQVAMVDYCGLVPGKSHDKFQQLNWTAQKADKVDAPYIDQCPVIIECKIIQHIELGLHTQFIGEIMEIKAEESVLDENDKPLTRKIKPIVYGTGDREYFEVGKSLGQAFSIGKTIKS